MVRYFKITEISQEAFIQATGEDLDCAQLVVGAQGCVFVAIDNDEEYEINDVPLEWFDGEG